MVICLERGAMQTCIWPGWCHCHSLSLASVKSRLVLHFWYRLTRVVLDKGPLNGCACVCVVDRRTDRQTDTGRHKPGRGAVCFSAEVAAVRRWVSTGIPCHPAFALSPPCAVWMEARCGLTGPRWPPEGCSRSADYTGKHTHNINSNRANITFCTLHCEAEKMNKFSFVCISFNTWQILTIFFTYWVYIKECISYNNVYLILARVKNFV